MIRFRPLYSFFSKEKAAKWASLLQPELFFEKAEFGDICKHTFKYILYVIQFQSNEKCQFCRRFIAASFNLQPLLNCVILLRFFLVSQLSRGPDNLFTLISFMLEQQ